MTQIADDLRAAEGTETLDPALRAKILAQAPPAPNPGGAGGEAGPSPVPPELRVRGRPSRAALAWAIGGAAVVLWFLLYPLSMSHRAGAPMASMPVPALSEQSHQIVAMGKNIVPYKARPGGGYPGRGGSAASSPALGMAPSSIASIETPVRQVHKEATIGVEVADAEAGSDRVTQMVKSAGGFVADNTLSTGDDGRKSADLTVKVPVIQFETVLGQIAKLGSVQAKNITGEDITEKTSDADRAEGVLEDEARRADARLKTLGKKAGWRDQQAARDTRIQLAQARARLDLLKKMAALSTLTVHLTEKAKPAPPPPVAGGFLSRLGDTTRAATASLLDSAGALLALLIWTLAYAPLWLPLALIGRYVYRRYWQMAA